MKEDAAFQFAAKSPRTYSTIRVMFMVIYVCMVTPFTVSFFMGIMPLPEVIKGNISIVYGWWIASASFLAFVENRSIKLATDLWNETRSRRVVTTVVFFVLLQTLPVFSIIYDIIGSQYDAAVATTTTRTGALANVISGNQSDLIQSDNVLGKMVNAYRTISTDTTARARVSQSSLLRLANRTLAQRSLVMRSNNSLTKELQKGDENISGMSSKLDFVVHNMFSRSAAIALLFPISLLAIGFTLREKRVLSGSIGDLLAVAETLPPQLQPSIKNILSAAVNAGLSSDYFKSRQRVGFVDLIANTEGDNALIASADELLKRVDTSQLSADVKESVKETVRNNLYSKLKKENNHVNN